MENPTPSIQPKDSKLSILVSKIKNLINPQRLPVIFNNPQNKHSFYFLGLLTLLFLFLTALYSFQVIAPFFLNGTKATFIPAFTKNLLVFLFSIGLGFLLLLNYIKIPFITDRLNMIKGKVHPVVKPHLDNFEGKAVTWSSNFKLANRTQKVRMLKIPILLLIIYYLVAAFGKNFLPPKLEVTYPGDKGKEIPLDSRIEFQFDRKINKVSFEKAFSINPNIAGKFEWNGDSSVAFIPDKNFDLASTYSIKLSPLVLSTLMIPTFATSEFKFDTIGNPTVLLASPQTEAPDADTPITVMFDRPMVPLTTLAEKAKLAPAFTIEPAVEGEGRWLGTSAYQFRPVKPLKNATTYTYTVPAGMKSEDGGELKDSYTYSFSTQRPRVLSTSPQDNYQYANPTASVSATLSLKIDSVSAKESLHLYKIEAGSESEVATQVKVSKNQVGIYATKPLDRGLSYKAKIEKGLLSSEGDNGTDVDYTWQFKTAPLPKILGSQPSDGDKDVGEVYQIAVNFVSPMSEKSFKDNIIISPVPERKPTFYFSSYNNQNSLYIGTYLNRSTTYTVTVKGAVKDQYGAILGSDYTFSFTTAPYKPSISIVPSGTYFATFNQDVIPRIVAKVVNANEVTYSLYKLKREDFLSLYKRVYIDYGNNNNLQNYDTSHLEKVREWKETFDLDKNVLANIITKVQKDSEEKFNPGLYFLDARIPSGAHDNLVMILTRTVLTLKTSPSQAFVWAVDQVTGDVESDTNIDLVRVGGDLVKNGKTNSDGVFKTDVELRPERQTYTDYQNPVFAFSQKGDDVSVVVDRWGSGINPYDFGLQGHYNYQETDDYQATQNLKVYLVLDRPIYRPGQTVYYKGIVREDNDGQYKLLDSGQVAQIKITESQGKEVTTQAVPLNSYGSFNGSFVLSSDASVGYYNISATIMGNGFSQSFQVEEYKKPDFSVDVTSDKPDYVDGGSVKLSIDSKFYFGAPLDHAPVTWTLTTTDAPFSWYKDNRFEFGDSDSYWYYPWWDYNPYSYFSGEKVDQGSGKTDADGHFEITLPIGISKKVTNQRMRLEAVVTDTNANQVIANTKEFVVHQAGLQVGVKPETYSGRENQEAKVDIVTVSIDGQELANIAVKASFYRRTWDYVKEEDSDTGEFYWTNKPSDTLISQSDVVTDNHGRGVASFVPSEGGTYRAVIEAVDSGGRITKSAAYLWISGHDLNMPQENHDRIVMVTDKDEYSIGENAHIVALVPYEETVGLVTIERGNIFDYKIVRTMSDSQSTDLTIKDNYSPNAYISGIFIKKGTGVKDPPQMKMGVVEIRVKNPTKQLDIDIKPNKDRYSPGEEMKLSINTKDQTGKNVQSEVALALVDESVWSLARVNLADIYQTFYQSRNLSVLTANALTVSMDRLNANVNLGSKGGSGGGGGEGGPETVRENFLDTAYWNATVETNVNGEANLSIKLPDNLTTWRIIAIAASKDTVVGDSTRNILVTKDVLIQPLIPRFLSVGDEPEVGLVIHNTTQNPAEVTATITSDALTVSDNGDKKLIVPAGGSTKIFWNASVQDKTSTDITFQVRETSGLSDALKLTIPIVSYYTPEVVATSGEAKDVATEKIHLPADIVSNMGGLNLSLSPSLGAGVEDATVFLLSYPYYCNEQIINRLTPAAALLDLAGQVNSQNIGGYSKSQLDSIVTDGIQRLVNTQRPDGGWGWWIDDPSDPQLSAMVLDGLKYASNLGFPVDKVVISKAANFIKQGLTKGGDNNLETQSYLASVLAGVEKIDPGILTRLMDRRWQVSPIARVYLLRALQEGGGSRQDTTRLMDEMLSLAKKTNTLTHWELPKRQWSFLGRNYTYTSVMLDALVKNNSQDNLIPEIVRWLMQARVDGNWGTTTETSASVRSIVGVMKARKEGNPAEKWQILVDNKLIKEGSITKGDLLKTIVNDISLDTLTKGEEVPVKIQKSGSGSLYYNMNLKYFLPFEEVGPVSEGLVISREFINSDGKVLDEEKLVAGQELWVRLTILAPTMVNHVIVEDKLPAGVEAVNESLATTSLLNVERLQTSKGKELLYFTHNEVRDDRVVLFANYLPQGIYEYTYRVRPTTPGKYHHPPAQVYNMYIPDIFGRSEGGWLEVAE